MAKLRQDPKTGCFEFEGTPQELLSIYDTLKRGTEKTVPLEGTIPHGIEPQRPTTVISTTALSSIASRMRELQQLDARMPTVDQLITYILSKPKFEHDILDVETHFFEKQVNSRKYGRLYRELRTKLENARKSIEASQHGAFERRSARPRNLQVYAFKPINSVLFGQPPQKTS